ncbi:MAG: hypothetical protein HC914_09610 [Chloroflexaceae bacterium]|nr:hypothetical protein [Chloroflexaceae bacterium]
MNGIALRLVLAVSWLVWVVGMLVVTVPVESQRKLLVGQATPTATAAASPTVVPAQRAFNVYMP